MEFIEKTEMEDKTITIFTDSQVTLDALRNNTDHTFVIEAIRKKGAEMRTTNWEIQFCWVKAHVGTHGNELADALAKEAATNMDLAENYKKVPKSVVMRELTEMSINTWQQQWDLTTKGAITKEYFPVVNERLKMNIKSTPNLTTMITGHGNIRSYLHRFRIINSPTCACGKNEQTINHILYNCEIIIRERDILISEVEKTHKWPVDKRQLIKEHYQCFIKFVNSLSFDKIDSYIEESKPT
jgi:hypothetical protein